jgi:tetratricopeptide (TPR) repeat protein
MLGRRKVIASVWILLSFSAAAFGQFPSPGGTPTPTSPGGGPYAEVGSVLVYLRTEDGQPLPQTALPVIRVSSTSGGISLPNVQSREGDGWVLSGLPIGDYYEVHVSANGYVPASTTVDLPQVTGATASVIIFMRPVDQELVFHRPAGQFVLAPKAAKEIQNALEDLQAGKIPSARKHTQKAMNLAPTNPYVQYIMGMTFLLSQQFAQAKPYLEKSVSMDPKEAQSLGALGTVRYQLGEDAGAIEVLTKVVQLDASSWRAEWMLAASYLQEKNYAEARDHANRALKIGGQKAAGVELVLGRALASLGDRDEAATAFETFASEFPKDPNTPTVREWAKMLRQSNKPAVSPVNLQFLSPGALNALNVLHDPSRTLVPQPPVEVPPRPNWAPPDVDAAKPFVIPGAACPLTQILKKAGRNAAELVRNLQEFSATEDFQQIELKHGDELEKPSEYDFDYLVFINQPSPEVFNVEEIREKNSVRTQLPGRIQDLGAPAMALAFHPVLQRDLDWTCEGLGTWDDQPAWVIRFEQKPKGPNVLARFIGASGSFPLALKGRAWVAEGSDRVLHLDTDLVHPIESVDLKREHFSIEYAPVSFPQHNVQLWLPENVDAYVQFQGHFLHYYHRFSDFKLFWVGTNQKIEAPKDAEKLEQQNKEQQQRH